MFARPALALLLCATAALLPSCKSHEEEVKEQKTKGAEMVENKAALIKGAGEALKDSGKEAAKSVTEGVGHVIKGVAEGVDAVENSFKIALHDSAKAMTLNASRVVTTEAAGRNKAMKVYIQSEKAFKGKLQLHALDSKNVEVGRSPKVEVNFDANDAVYITFPFDEATPFSRTAQFVLHAQ